jgi:phosphinothricin acetyltransferase
MEHSIILAPRAMRQGIGRQLMERLCRHASKNGVHSLWAGVSAANLAGLKFHKALGFQERARLPEVGYKFETWLDLILMQKIL